MKQYAIAVLVAAVLTTPAVGEILLWDTGATHQVIFNGNPTYLGFSSGFVAAGQPQRWCAIPFRITVPNAVITRIEADLFTVGAPTHMFYKIWTRAGEPSTNPPGTLVTEGSTLIGIGTDDPRVPIADDYLHVYEVNIPIAVGDYYLTIFGGTFPETVGNYLAWQTGADLQAEDLEWNRMYRSATWPSPGFQPYTSTAIQPVAGQDPDDIWNCAFTLWGVQDLPAACCTYSNGVGSCQVLTATDCAAAGGTYYEGQSCDGWFCPPQVTSDVSPSAAVIDLELYGLGTYSINLESVCMPDTIVKRDAPPYPYPPNPDWGEIETELAALELAGDIPGVGPIRVNLADSPASTGQVINPVPSPGNQNIVSGDSFFDVFVEIEVPQLGALVNLAPIRVAAHIEEDLPGTGALPPDEHFIFQPSGSAGTTGDVNGLSGANGADIQCFISCLLPGGPLPGCTCDCADMDRVSGVTIADIPLFVDVLLGLTSPQPCGGAADVELFPKAGGPAVGKITGVEHWLIPEVPDLIYYQIPDGSTGYTGDLGAGDYLIQDFIPASGLITDLHWWGITEYYSGAWTHCDENPMDFVIQFYEDTWNGSSHAPGKVVCGPYTLTAYGVPDGTFGGNPIFYYSAPSLTPACALGYGWVSVQGVSDPDTCWFLWIDAISSSPEDVSSWQNGGPFSPEDQVALCVTGTPQLFTGGCCLDQGGGVFVCEVLDNYSCWLQHGVFKGPGSDCSGASPCNGACCYDADLDPAHPGWLVRACAETAPDECTTTLGENPVFLGPGTSCLPTNPCTQPLGACCLAEPGETCSWCVEVTAVECVALGGSNWSLETCGGPACWPRCGACCDGADCDVKREEDPGDPCLGIFYRDVDCTPNPCIDSAGVDYCTSAVSKVITAGGTLNIFGDTTYSTNDCPDLSPEPEFWHGFEIVDPCVDLTLKLCGSDPEHTAIEIVLYKDCPCQGTEERRIEADEWDWTSCPGEGNPRLLWRSLAPGIYYYPVYGGFRGPYVGTISAEACPPPP